MLPLCLKTGGERGSLISQIKAFQSHNTATQICSQEILTTFTKKITHLTTPLLMLLCPLGIPPVTNFGFSWERDVNTQYPNTLLLCCKQVLPPCFESQMAAWPVASLCNSNHIYRDHLLRRGLLWCAYSHLNIFVSEMVFIFLSSPRYYLIHSADDLFGFWVTVPMLNISIWLAAVNFHWAPCNNSL